MKDRVVYEITLGQLSQLVAGSYVRNDVISIFSYRKIIITQLKTKWENQTLTRSFENET
jgi:hypothetical protein